MDFKNLFRQWAPKVLPYAAVLVVGAGIGWALKPDVVRVEEKVKTVEVEKQVVVEKEVVRVEVVKVKDTQVVERWHREKTDETKPDGTRTVKEIEDRNIDSVVKERENSTTVQVVEVEKQVVVTRDVVVEKVIEPVLKNWRAGLLVGVAPRFDTPAETAIMVGVEAQRRIAGPFSASLWVLGGSPVTGFKLTGVSAGLGLNVEF